EGVGAYLWSADKLPAGVDLMVLSANNQILFTSDAEVLSAPPSKSHAESAGLMEWESSTEVDEAAYRDLFLRPEFLTDRWTVIARQRDRAHSQAMQHLRNTLLL